MDRIKKQLKKKNLPLEGLGMRISEKNLIVFDNKVVILTLVLIGAFFILSLSKINYSSVSCWNKFIPEKDDKIIGDPLLGTAKEIRSDEWHVITPFMLSQANQESAFPVSNEALGGRKTPLLMNLPVKHFSTLFRPQNWAFFIFNFERAYAFYWNFKVFGLVLGFFFLLLLLTRNNFWLSLLGSLWLFFSTYIQWWFSTPAMLPEMITSFSFVFIGLAYALFSERKPAIILGSLLMLVFGVNYALFFYPPFQIILAYLFVFLLVGYIGRNFDKERFNRFRYTRFLSLFLFAVLASSALFFFYQDAKETIAATMQTEYPGKRTMTGGGESLSRIFSGYYDFFWNEKFFPKIMGFEGNFILFFPLILLLLAARAIKDRAWVKRDFDKYLLGIYLAIIMVWIFWGFPDSVSRFSLFKMIHPIRTLLGLGMGSIILTVMYLADTQITGKNLFKIRNIFYFILFFLLAFLTGKYFAETSFLWKYLICCSLAVSFLALMLALDRWKLFFLLLLLLIALPNFPVNPVNYGLDAINKKEIVLAAKEKVELNPKSKWLVFGNYFLANLVKTTGANVINGVNFVPEFEKNKILDPESKFQSVYNRYGNIEYDASDNVDAQYTLDYLDKYTVAINPCSEKIKELGIDYIVISKNYKKTDCLTRVSSKAANGMHIYLLK